MEDELEDEPDQDETDDQAEDQAADIRDGLTAEDYDQIAAELEELQSLRAEVAELRGWREERERLDQAREVAAGLVAPDRIGALLKLADLSGDGDPREALEAAVKQHPFIAASEQGRPRTLPRDENGNRGQSSAVNDGKIRISQSQLADPEFMTQVMAAIAKNPDALEISDR
jgi:hypothetical protein